MFKIKSLALLTTLFEASILHVSAAGDLKIRWETGGVVFPAGGKLNGNGDEGYRGEISGKTHFTWQIEEDHKVAWYVEFVAESTKNYEGTAEFNLISRSPYVEVIDDKDGGVVLRSSSATCEVAEGCYQNTISFDTVSLG
ncbi:hypothetical protein I302_108924 [Kwoniella bestiolae CBS 10118]|uniref:Secreted protein n=1 Tax=Kwoniella bestiolae CBS 10118 TaxID=1296100 RepID=A0A1B9FUH4_9TREE|nr:hypothetical protein I302_08065 [Kwoniella bestiolae CBS 10118]OCF22417.1 hypothetical protein I302_08065 [Kwoniella bestiolae CBS 10118]